MPLHVSGEMLEVTCVSMGNPHCITFVEQLNDHWVLDIGPKVERDAHFPSRVNASFVEVISQDEVRARVLGTEEAGETQACGTGACGHLCGRVRSPVRPLVR